MNVVFDLGGVVVTWEPERIIAAAFDDPEVRATVRDRIIGHPDWIELDRGTLPREDAVRRAAHRTLLPEADVDAFLRQVPHALVPVPSTVDLLRRVKVAGHSLYCLSNMHTASIEHLERSYAFWDVFDGTVISCRVHLCKPEPAIYRHLLETHRLNPADTVFVDDLDVNLNAAAAFGIRTIRFEHVAQCERALRILGGL
jgi:putative hydrolase of the HAD superfamily